MQTRAPRTRPIGRRAVLRGAASLSLALPLRAAAVSLSLARPLRASAQEPDPAQGRPQQHDRFVFALGSRAGEVVAPDDVVLGEPQLFAYPMDPTTAVVRDGSRLSQVMLVRLDPSDLTDETLARAADGIVAYSGVCSHTGCDVTEWLSGPRMLLCPCHDSEFDPADAARVDIGPAPRRLAALPLDIVDGALVAAGSFLGRVGAAEQ